MSVCETRASGGSTATVDLSRRRARIHVDFAGPFLEQMFLLLVDAYSKWAEVRMMGGNTQTAKTIEMLRFIFASYGLPEQQVSDNEPQFVSEEFERFATDYIIKHIRSEPYHPATNRAAERFIQTFKLAMKMNTDLSISHRRVDFLLADRTTPYVTTNVAQSVLFLNRLLRTRLSLLQPNIQSQECANKLIRRNNMTGIYTARIFCRTTYVIGSEREGKIQWRS